MPPTCRFWVEPKKTLQFPVTIIFIFIPLIKLLNITPFSYNGYIYEKVVSHEFYTKINRDEMANITI